MSENNRGMTHVLNVLPACDIDTLFSTHQALF